MGCGHSKINIYPKKTRSKNNCKKMVSAEHPKIEEDENNENDPEMQENIEDCDQKRTIKVKPVGGPLLAQMEISSSQQNFFRMLDEKIENGPDYDSTSETERAVEAARLSALLKDWETASAGSRSLPVTPKRRNRLDKTRNELPHPVETHRPSGDRFYPSQPIPASVIHQSYGVTQGGYRQSTFNPGYVAQGYNPYENVSAMYGNPANQVVYGQPGRSQYPSYMQHASPVKGTSPKHIPYENQMVSYNSSSHKVYGPKVGYTNGELLQQQIYNHQVQYQQAREYQQYKQTREQMLIQQQGYMATRSYQSSVHIPIVSQTSATSEVSPMHRKQYELT